MIVGELKELLDEYPGDMCIFEDVDLAVIREFDYSSNCFRDSLCLSLLGLDEGSCYNIGDALEFLECVGDDVYPVLDYLFDVLRTLLRYRVSCYADGEYVANDDEPVMLKELEESLNSKLEALKEISCLLGDD